MVSTSHVMLPSPWFAHVVISLLETGLSLAYMARSLSFVHLRYICHKSLEKSVLAGRRYWAGIRWKSYAHSVVLYSVVCRKVCRVQAGCLLEEEYCPAQLCSIEVLCP